MTDNVEQSGENKPNRDLINKDLINKGLINKSEVNGVYRDRNPKNGRFVQGNAGRPKGIPNRHTSLKKKFVAGLDAAVIEEQIQEIVFKSLNSADPKERLATLKLTLDALGNSAYKDESEADDKPTHININISKSKRDSHLPNKTPPRKEEAT